MVTVLGGGREDACLKREDVVEFAAKLRDHLQVNVYAPESEQHALAEACILLEWYIGVLTVREKLNDRE